MPFFLFVNFNGALEVFGEGRRRGESNGMELISVY